MLSTERVAQIRSFLTDGRMSQRAIARTLRVSRGTVEAIAQNRRPNYAARAENRLAGRDPPAGPVERCPGCGGMVQMPCLACRLRAMRKRPDALPGGIP